MGPKDSIVKNIVVVKNSGVLKILGFRHFLSSKKFWGCEHFLALIILELANLGFPIMGFANRGLLILGFDNLTAKLVSGGPNPLADRLIGTYSFGKFTVGLYKLQDISLKHNFLTHLLVFMSVLALPGTS